MMKQLIQEKWKENYYILEPNMILYYDGTVTVLDVTTYYTSKLKRYETNIRPIADSTLESVMNYSEDPWVSINIWHELEVKEGSYVCGAMGLGNEGFVAKLDQDKMLVWAQSYDFSNPIRQLILVEDELIGITEHNESYISITLKDITKIKMTYETYDL